MARGQLVVELALVMPILLSILLGMAAIGFLYVSQHRMQNGIDVLAQLAAQDPSWRSAVPSENERTDCNAEPLQPEATAYPDGRILLTWSCHLETRWIFDGLEIVVSSEAVIRPTDAP